MVTDIFTQEVLQFAKIIAIIFALVHFLIGFVLTRQIFRMNQIIRTKIANVLGLLGILYLGVLTIVLLLLIFV